MVKSRVLIGAGIIIGVGGVLAGIYIPKGDIRSLIPLVVGGATIVLGGTLARVRHGGLALGPIGPTEAAEVSLNKTEITIIIYGVILFLSYLLGIAIVLVAGKMGT